MGCGWDKMEDLGCRLEGVIGYEPWNDEMGDMCEQVDTRAQGIQIPTIGMGCRRGWYEVAVLTTRSLEDVPRPKNQLLVLVVIDRRWFGLRLQESFQRRFFVNHPGPTPKGSRRPRARLQK